MSDRELYLDISLKIRKARQLKGYRSATAFSELNNIKEATYQRMESGNHNFSLGSLNRVLKVHNLTLKQLLEL